ncbi:MAG TPA: hypothetical protein VGB77_15695 [Abditibacteriaceae bacterium]|jgi:hypothetical protein
MKLNVKLGPIEFEYEGSEEFLKDELPAVLETFSQIDVKTFNVGSGNGGPTLGSQSGIGSSTSSGNAAIQLSSGNIAAKLDCKSGSDLVIAACAHLTLVMNKEAFSRKDILEDMQTATSYYKVTYSKNLTQSLATLIKDGKLIERSKNSYALHASQRTQLEAILAQ